MVTKVADLSVFRHSLAAGRVEALKYFRAVHLIQKNGNLKSKGQKAYLVEISHILPFGITFASTLNFKRRGNGELHPHGVPVFPSPEE
jgi:hypothetical protein